MSVTHVAGGTMNFEDINLEQSYTPVKDYCQNKLANVMFCKELARRLQGLSVVYYISEC
jgi:hypothetical protein